MSADRILIVGFLFVHFMLLPSFSQAQKSRKDLEREKKENLKKITEVQQILKETESEKATTLGQLKALNQQIKVRQQLIASINEEVTYLDEEISQITIVIESLENDLEELKKEYALMIYSAFKTKNKVNRLTFLFSASSFNQFLIRLKYLKQYAEMRNKQVVQINKVKMALTEQKGVGISKRKEQHGLLQDKLQESKALSNLKSKQTGLVTALNKKQNQLRKEVNARKQAVEKLNKLIAGLIKTEMDKNTSSANSKVLSSTFEKNQSKLPWPVNTGFISSAFGRHPHPVLKGIEVENQGIDIQTQSGEQVKAVFDGEVVTKAFIPGMNNVVIIRHGDYYTLYAKLKEVMVDKGQKVVVSEAIGEVFTDKEGISEVQFQVWKNQKKMDPAKWLVSSK